MTSIDEYVAASEDDARENGDGSWKDYTYTTNPIRSKTNPGASNYYCCGCRFTPDIPQGATIISAYVEMYQNHPDNDCNCTLYGNDVDDADDFATDTNIISRTRTSASVDWSQDDIGQGNWFGSAIEIKTIIQEIVNRPGWAANQGLVLLFIANTDVSKDCYFYSYDTGGTNDPHLRVEYEVAVAEAYGFVV